MNAITYAAVQLLRNEAQRTLPVLRRSLTNDSVDALFCALLSAQWGTASAILSDVIAEDIERPAGDVQALLALLCGIERAQEQTGVTPRMTLLPPPPEEDARADYGAWAASLLTHVDVVDVGDRGVALALPCDNPDCEACEARMEVWPAAPPTMPYQLDHEPSLL